MRSLREKRIPAKKLDKINSGDILILSEKRERADEGKYVAANVQRET